jgi:hypothetical protein
VITRGIRELVSRDWDRARRAKDTYWGERVSRLGAAEGFRVADELRRQALLHRPVWPDAEERATDLEAHIRLSALLRRGDRTGRP